MNGREALGVLHERSYLRAYVWNKLFQREVLDGIRFSTELSFAEDYEMFCRVLEQCDMIVCGTKRSITICRENPAYVIVDTTGYTRRQ